MRKCNPRRRGPSILAETLPVGVLTLLDADAVAVGADAGAGTLAPELGRAGDEVGVVLVALAVDLHGLAIDEAAARAVGGQLVRHGRPSSKEELTTGADRRPDR